MPTRPTLRTEKALCRREDVRYVVGVDEVGRGALAGPVTVGVVVVDAAVGRVPAGLADSKLLSASRREALVPAIHRWCRSSAVGHASPGEIDRVGLTAALRLAGLRALAELEVAPDIVLLDGSHDWLTPPRAIADEPGLFDVVDLRVEPSRVPVSGVPVSGVPVSGPPVSGPPVSGPPVPVVEFPDVQVPEVVTMIKADLTCATVAAASVLAKTTRDAIMVDLSASHPAFGWHENKGYASEGHRDGLRRNGACEHHRRSWNLGTAEANGTGPRDDTGLGDDPELGEYTELAVVGGPAASGRSGGGDRDGR